MLRALHVFKASLEEADVQECAEIENLASLDGLRVTSSSSRVVSVTDIAQLVWCEFQVYLSQRPGVPKPEPRECMVAGTEAHLALELELHDIVPVETKTRADVWAVKMIRAIQGVRELLLDGKTRELWVFGSLEGTWLSGVIDELFVHPRSKQAMIREHKTRSSTHPPTIAAKRVARIQVIIYKLLLDRLSSGTWIETDKFLRKCRLSRDDVFSDSVVELLAENQLTHVTCLGHLVSELVEVYKFIGRTSTLLQVEYQSLVEPQLSWNEMFLFSQEEAEHQLRDLFSCWNGERHPEKVILDERWKCNSCPWKEDCFKYT
jgi:exonuclease V